MSPVRGTTHRGHLPARRAHPTEPGVRSSKPTEQPEPIEEVEFGAVRCDPWRRGIRNGVRHRSGIPPPVDAAGELGRQRRATARWRGRSARSVSRLPIAWIDPSWNASATSVRPSSKAMTVIARRGSTPVDRLRRVRRPDVQAALPHVDVDQAPRRVRFGHDVSRRSIARRGHLRAGRCQSAATSSRIQ